MPKKAIETIFHQEIIKTNGLRGAQENPNVVIMENSSADKDRESFIGQALDQMDQPQIKQPMVDLPKAIETHDSSLEAQARADAYMKWKQKSNNWR